MYLTCLCNIMAFSMILRLWLSSSVRNTYLTLFCSLDVFSKLLQVNVYLRHKKSIVIIIWQWRKVLNIRLSQSQLIVKTRQWKKKCEIGDVNPFHMIQKRKEASTCLCAIANRPIVWWHTIGSFSRSNKNDRSFFFSLLILFKMYISRTYC